MKKIFAIITLALATTFAVSAQNHSNSIGLSVVDSFSKYGSPGFGIEFKNFTNDVNTLDIRGHYFGKWGSEFKVLYEWNYFVTDKVHLYAGPGAHFGVVPDSDSSGSGKSTVAYGVAAVAGVEYDLSILPMAVSFDWQPIYTWQTTYDGGVFAARRFDVGLKYCF